MEQQILSKCLQQLWQERQGLEDAERKRQRSVELLNDFNTSAHCFLKLIERLLARQSEELDSRMVLQQAVNCLSLEEQASSMFWNDQLAFYGNWLTVFEKELYADQDRCLLKLSVKELLVLLRLGKDLKLLGDSQLKQLFQFVSLHIRTERQEVLSYESLRKKYSQIDLETLRQVKKLLDRLSGQMNHYFALLSNK